MVNGLSKIFVAAPAGFATGGPELLHQLAYKLKQRGFSVRMCYFPERVSGPVHKNYVEYELEYTRTVEDCESNLLIVPETMASLLFNYRRIRKAVWWLSVDNYFWSLPGVRGVANTCLYQFFDLQKYFFFQSGLLGVDIHLAQSEYAKTFLEKSGVKSIRYLSDFLHDSFLNIEAPLEKKVNVVAYNPKKGMRFTKALIKRSPEIKFVPIQDLSRDGVVELLRSSKVYIDFGHHPGKDRIPREAAVLNNCVITSRRGAAYFDRDLPIDGAFKIDDRKENIEYIKALITKCFDDFEQELKKFNRYVDEVRQQEFVFDNELHEVFC